MNKNKSVYSVKIVYYLVVIIFGLMMGIRKSIRLTVSFIRAKVVRIEGLKYYIRL